MDHTSRIILALPLLLLAAAGCDAFASCPEATGAPIRQARTTAPFTRIHARGSLEVVLQQGKVASVEVEAPADLADRVVTDVAGGELVISTDGCYRSRAPVRVRVVAPAIAGIRLSGSGDVVAGGAIRGAALDLDLSGSGSIRLAAAVDHLRVALAGSGGVRLSGRAARLDASLSGSGDLDAAGLHADRVDARLSGSGDAEVRASEALAAAISGSGDLVYHGRPADVARSVVGSGTIRPAR